MFLLYKKMVHKNYFLIIASLLILTPRVFAQWGGWGYYYSPMDYLNSEWVLFAIISLVFFAVIFYTVNKSFHNKAVAGTIAIALSLLIAMTFSQKMLFMGFIGEDLGTWVFIAVALISMGFIIKFVYEGLGSIGAVVAVIGMWFVLRAVDPYQFFPTSLLTNELFMNIYGFIASIFGLIIVIILAILLIKVGGKPTNIERFGKYMFKRS